jgi:uncharacterized membrane protein
MLLSKGEEAMGQPNVTDEERLWAMLAHLLALLGYVVWLGAYIAPLVIYLVYKDKSQFVAFHALAVVVFPTGAVGCGSNLCFVGDYHRVGVHCYSPCACRQRWEHSLTSSLPLFALTMANFLSIGSLGSGQGKLWGFDEFTNHRGKGFRVPCRQEQA